MIKAIMAISRDNRVGSSRTKSGLPWEHGVYPEDMRHFRCVTTGGVLVMGRKTFDEVGKLPYRRNYVVTSTGSGMQDGGYVKICMDTLQRCLCSGDSIFNYEPTWIIGGKSTYQQTMQHIEEFHITRIADEYPDADVIFNVDKELDRWNFRLVDSQFLSDRCELQIWRKYE